MPPRNDRQKPPPMPGGARRAAAAGPLQRALELQRMGRLVEAERLYRTILAADPGNAQAGVLCAQVTAQQGHVERGVEMLEQVVRARPAFVPALNGLAALSLQLRRLPAAETACRRALELAPDNAAAHFNWGQIAETAGRPADAAVSYARALELNLGFSAARLPLAVALHKLGRLDEAVAAYQGVPAGDPAAFAARFNLGMLHQERDEWAAAAAAYERAIELAPDEAGPHLHLGNVFYAMGRPAAAAAAYRRLLALAPAMADVHGNLAKALWAEGDAAGAFAACDDGLRQRPGDTAILAFKAALLQETGDGAAARTLVDFDRFLRPTRLEPPAGFATLADFNAALAQFALGHPTLVHERRGNATKDGKHTADLLEGPKGPVALLEQAIEHAVGCYLRQLPEDPGHPFTVNQPARWKLSAWAVVMEGQGYQVPHIHPLAWLSGVYYASVPPSIGAADADHAGWIEFGEPLPEFGCKRAPDLRLIRPEEGLMLLFPSYFHHRTLPFRAAETRISFAFDVMRTT